MKKVFFALFLLSATSVMAQKSTLSGSQSTDKSTIPDIKEKLVTLALQNPDNEIADLHTNIAKYQVKNAKAAWVNNISLSGNVNEFTLQKNNPYSTYYPKYNFGVSIPLGFFTTHANEVKIAKANLQIAHAEKNNLYRKIREAVLSDYEDYLMYKQLLTLQNQLTENEYTNYLQAEKKFGNGEIQITEYNNATKVYNEAQTSKIKAQHDLNVAQLALEQLIGTNLDEVLAQYQQQK